MKKLILITILGVSFYLTSFSQSANEKVAAILKQQDYFELARQYPSVKKDLGPVMDLMSRAMLANAFNKPEEAIRTSDSIIRNHQSQLGLQDVMGLILIKSSNLFRTGHYKEADAVLNQILENPVVVENIPAETLSSFGELKKKTEALKDLPPMSFSRPEKDCEISFSTGPAWLIKVNASVNGKRSSFIFDTGADCPAFVSEKFAKDNGIRIIADSIKSYGSDGPIYTKMGFAETLSIGDITFSNVWCLVSDQMEINPEEDTIKLIHAVFGRQLMSLAGEFSIYPEKKKMIFPYKRQVEDSEPNIALYNGQPYVEAKSGKEKYLFHLDTGGETSLTSKYYIRHKQEIDASLPLDTVKSRVPWLKPVAGFQMPLFTLSVAGKSQKITDIRIFTVENPAESGEGIIAMDFLNKFEKVTLDFNRMIIDLK